MKIRRATPGDARAIATVQVAGWRATYRGIVILGSESLVLLAEEGGEVVAWTAPLLAVGEIKGLYVRPDRLRRGIGSALLRQAHDALARAGREEAVLWVFEENASARAFYAAHGYAPDGARTVDESGAAEVRLWARLGSG